MARKNTARVSEKIDYIKDIKGKRLIRLSAGVCSGKNFAFVKIANDFPDLRILLITSRKNTVIAQAKKMGANTFFDFDKLVDNEISTQKHNRIVCTNAAIEKFFKNKYNSKNPNTYLWDMFDLIVLDEAHALTTDATFTDCFYTERFLKHTYYKNPKCDIVFMSGTIEPLNWMIDAPYTPFIHDLNYFDDCVHLEPNAVIVINKDKLRKYIYNLWLKGERMLYFANFKSSIAELTTELIKMGIPNSEFGFSFNYKDSDDNEKVQFPQIIADTLEQRIDDMNTALTTEERVPSNIKILFSTSKNKEGINILDDDIKTIFAETHNKSELIQIAGRVRGNDETGEGIDTLVIIADAKQHTSNYPNNFIYMLNKHIAEGLTAVFKECIAERKYDISVPNDLIKKLPQYEDKKTYKYIRYDYIGENYAPYTGRIEGERQHFQNIMEFKDIVNDSVLRKDSAGNYIVLTGQEIMEEEWFRWSKVYILSEIDKIKKGKVKDIAREQLIAFLRESNYMGEKPHITKIDKDIIKAEIERLADLYGYKALGLKEGFDKIGFALRKFDLQIKEVCKRNNYQTYEIIDLRS